MRQDKSVSVGKHFAHLDPGYLQLIRRKLYAGGNKTVISKYP